MYFLTYVKVIKKIVRDRGKFGKFQHGPPYRN